MLFICNILVLAGFSFHKKNKGYFHILATNNVPDAHTPTSDRIRMLSVFILLFGLRNVLLFFFTAKFCLDPFFGSSVGFMRRFLKYPDQVFSFELL